jgi:hypothetical protein
MRFSLKWLLAAAIYVALAAAAFSQTHWLYADVLWAISLLALVYAGMTAFLAQDRRRAAAAGFLLASLCFLVYVTMTSYLRTDSTPITRLLVAAGYEQYQGASVAFPAVPQPAIPATGQLIQAGTPLYSHSLNLAAPTAQIAAVPMPASPVAEFAQYVRAANAVGMMVFGLLGILAAALVRRSIDAKPLAVSRA